MGERFGVPAVAVDSADTLGLELERPPMHKGLLIENHVADL